MADRFTPDDSSIDLETFQDWVRRTAENEETSPEAVIQQLMSTYWILNELMETLEETPYEQLIDEELSEDFSQDDFADEQASDSVESRNEIVDVIKAIAEFSNKPAESAPERSRDGIDPTLIEIIEALQSQPQNQQPPGFDPNIAHTSNQIEILRDKITDIRDDIKNLNEHISSIQDDTEGAVEGIRDRVSDVKQTTKELEANQRQLSDRSEANFAELSNKLQNFGERLDAKADQTDLNEIESMTDEEFDAIERAFEQLLQSIDDIEGRLESSTESNTRELETLFEQAKELQHLANLKQDAMRKGINKAVCDNCNQKIRLGLLPTPFCPNCDRRLSQIESHGWNPFKSPRIVTEPIRSVATSDRDSS